MLALKVIFDENWISLPDLFTKPLYTSDNGIKNEIKLENESKIEEIVGQHGWICEAKKEMSLTMLRQYIPGLNNILSGTEREERLVNNFEMKGKRNSDINEDFKKEIFMQT